MCPLCGKQNRCAVVAGTDPFKCWCNTTKVPKELLDRVPEEQKGKACVCRDCIEKYLEGKND